MNRTLLPDFYLKYISLEFCKVFVMNEVGPLLGLARAEPFETSTITYAH